MTKLAYAGTFNPLTTGHTNVVLTALKLADHIVLIIAQNPNKSANAQADAYSYVNAWIAEENLQDRVSVVLGGPKELSVDIAMDNNCVGFIRGMRNLVDFEAEKELAHMNENVVGELPTFHIISPANLIGVSSTMVRNLSGTRNWWKTIKNYLPKSVYNLYLRNYIRDNVCAISDEVFHNYCQSEYHSLAHVAHILYLIDNNYKNHPNYWALKYAAVYHDACKSVDDSVAIMKKELPDSVGSIGEVAASYIVNTKYDNGFVPDEFSECDLSILASSWKDYSEYMDNVRKEYSEISDADFNKGRCSFLNTLKRKVLFMSSSTDTIAKQNIEKEIVCRS